MNDDRMRHERDRETFEAIVAELDDPELVLLRRMFVLLGVTVYAAGLLTLTTVAGLGWPGAIGFTSTFVPGLVVAWRRRRRRFPGHPGDAPRPFGLSVPGGPTPAP